MGLRAMPPVFYSKRHSKLWLQWRAVYPGEGVVMQMSVTDHLFRSEKENETAKNSYVQAGDKFDEDGSQSDKKSNKSVRGKDHHFFIVPFVY
ncbi:hypothetical protein JXB22_09785 [candidate division WOR-3 bacterium]|nr:hypothetical protein [candidate division WOR-3 bacterium]